MRAPREKRREDMTYAEDKGRDLEKVVFLSMITVLWGGWIWGRAGPLVGDCLAGCEDCASERHGGYG